MSNDCAHRTFLISLSKAGIVQRMKMTSSYKILLSTDRTEFDQTANPSSVQYFTSAFQTH